MFLNYKLQLFASEYVSFRLSFIISKVSFAELSMCLFAGKDILGLE